MKAEKLQKILEKHRKWINDEGGERANLQEANLRGADLDFSCWPLWCGSLDVHIDERIAVQLLYHLLRTVQVSPGVSDEIKRYLFTKPLVEIANKFHRVNECGEIRIGESI